MDEIQLDTQQDRASVFYSKLQKSNERPRVINFLMKSGIVKNEKGAIRLVLVLCLVCLGIAGYMYFFSSNSSSGFKTAGEIIMKTYEK